MMDVLQFVFSDFWHFIGVCVFMMIVAFWKPIDITVMRGYWKDGDNDGK